ncbi:hypothetical protein [Psychromonas sp. KJ10-2]|uniref:hypothetical protein n=1 Tax=Psychromonas sp. KJ10-2 TaxID=3391822 RepID=UPI0039B56732
MLRSLYLLMVGCLLLLATLSVQANGFVTSQFIDIVQRFSIPHFTRTIFVDRQLKRACENYDTARRHCANGQHLAVTSLAEATAMAEPAIFFDSCWPLSASTAFNQKWNSICLYRLCCLSR